MDENTINWMGYMWLTHETWGRYHPKNIQQWYDTDCVQIKGDDSLSLYTKYKPKRFTGEHEGIPYDNVAETAVGLVSCQYLFHFGKYEIVAKLPSGPNLWPAIWLWSLTEWPPEIDIIEAYSNHKGSYFDWNIFPYKVKRNFFYRENGKVEQVGAKNIWVGFRPPNKRFVKYQMEWTPDHIKIGANGCYSRIIDGEVMKYYQEPMRFIINNAVHKDHPVGAPYTEFKIKSFKYTKL